MKVKIVHGESDRNQLWQLRIEVFPTKNSASPVLVSFFLPNIQERVLFIHEAEQLSKPGFS